MILLNPKTNKLYYYKTKNYLIKKKNFFTLNFF